MPDSLKAKTSVLIVAAGSGTRLGGSPKALLELDGKTLVEHVVQAVSVFTSQVIVGVRAVDVAHVQSLLGDDVTVVSGGASRQETVETLFALADREIVMIHDVARPFTTPALYQSVLEAAVEYGGAAPVLPASTIDSVAVREGNWLGAALPRDRVVRIQTPYAFAHSALQDALQQAKDEGWEDTSVTTLLTRAGHEVRLIEGEAVNTKITYPEDIDGSRIVTASAT